MTKLTDWRSAMLEKHVADEGGRARKSLDDLAALRDMLEAG
jgi:hypothetical protein